MNILFNLYKISYNSKTGKPTIFYKNRDKWVNVLTAETPEELSNLFIEKYKSKIRPFADLDFKKFNYMKGAVKQMPKLAESKLSKWINGIINEEISKSRLKESKLTEKSESEEIREMAVDLIDYLGAQIPPQISPRAIRFFRELGFKDTDPMVKKVYQTALQLNSGNR